MELADIISSLDGLLKTAAEDGVQNEVEIVLTFGMATEILGLLRMFEVQVQMEQPASEEDTGAYENTQGYNWESPFENSSYSNYHAHSFSESGSINEEQLRELLDSILKAKRRQQERAQSTWNSTWSDAMRAAAEEMRRQQEEAYRGRRQTPGKRAWHEVLGVPPNADRATITRAYRKLAAIHHPDKGGSVERMAEINKARDEALR